MRWKIGEIGEIDAALDFEVLINSQEEGEELCAKGGWNQETSVLLSSRNSSADVLSTSYQTQHIEGLRRRSNSWLNVTQT